MRLWVVVSLVLIVSASIASAEQPQSAPLPGCMKPVQLGTDVLCMDEKGVTVGNGALPPPIAPTKVDKPKSARRATPAEIDSAVAALPTGNGWSVEQEVSKISDTVNIYLSLFSENYMSDDRGGTARALLFIRCKDDVTSVIFSIGQHWFHREHYVKSRIDKKKLREKLWGGSTDNRSIFYPGAIVFAKELAAAKTLLIEVAPINSGSLLAEFDVAGLDTAIAPLRMACGWQ